MSAPIEYRARLPAERDRLMFVLVLVCVVHALAIFGIRFVTEDPAPFSPAPSIEIIINQSSNDILPDETAFLGRSDSAGGDPQIVDNIRRSDIFASVSAQQDIGVAPTSQEPLNAPSPTSYAPNVLTVFANEHSVASQPEAEPDEQVSQVNSLIDKEAQQIASLTQELRLKYEKLSQQQRELTLNANTREYIAAEYVNSWIRSVESIGNINLPAHARILTGQVILEVNINSHGELLNSRVLHSSGHPPLDEAALNSVKLASPFKPFSAQLRKKVDILNIVRTWSYNRGDLSTIATVK